MVARHGNILVRQPEIRARQALRDRKVNRALREIRVTRENRAIRFSRM
jgi:hypothetical protein